MLLDEEILYRELGQRIKAERNRLKLTQAKLAEESGVSRATIAVIEVGKQSTPLHVVYKLCLALNIEVTNLLPSNNEVITHPVRDQFENLPFTADFVEEAKKILDRGINYGTER